MQSEIETVNATVDYKSVINDRLSKSIRSYAHDMHLEALSSVSKCNRRFMKSIMEKGAK